MSFFMEIIARRQKPIVLCHYVGTLANGSSTGFESPCAGYAWASGIVFSDREVSFQLEQGANDLGGALAYRHASPLVVVAAGTAEQRRFPVSGRFCRLVIANASGGVANVEAYFELRGFE